MQRRKRLSFNRPVPYATMMTWDHGQSSSRQGTPPPPLWKFKHKNKLFFFGLTVNKLDIFFPPAGSGWCASISPTPCCSWSSTTFQAWRKIYYTCTAIYSGCCSLCIANNRATGRVDLFGPVSKRTNKRETCTRCIGRDTSDHLCQHHCWLWTTVSALVGYNVQLEKMCRLYQTAGWEINNHLFINRWEIGLVVAQQLLRCTYWLCSTIHTEDFMDMLHLLVRNSFSVSKAIAISQCDLTR